jgi:DNA-binding NarL/FixJ family response regulator
MSNVEIAHTLYLSDGTVRNHVSAILTKLGVADRTQAAILAIRHGV